MRRKLVLWGSDEKDEKILVALELVDQENKVYVYTFKQDVATEDFYNAMLNQWREDKEVEFPAHTKIERELSIADAILPEEIKVDRTDLVTRAQTEWHFVVLSAKLYQMYKSEVEDLTETIEGMASYDNAVWNDLKNFWSKVQEQVYEKNLFREHAASLKNKTNDLFDKLKVMKKALDKQFDEVSGKHKETVMTQLQDIEARVEKGMGLKPIFEELKQLQAQIKGMDFSRKHRRQVWDKLDAAFKVVKDKRFGDKGAATGSNSAKGRLERRLSGLNEAIGKMERSIKRDKDDQAWQTKRVNTTDGQLEMQIRQAKIKMIDERINSKEVKLADMVKTRVELQDRIEKAAAKEARDAAKAETDKLKAEAAAAAKAKIAAEIKTNTDQLDAEKLEKAASLIADAKKTKKVPPVELPKEEPTDEDEKTDTAEVEAKVAEVLDAVEDKIEDVKEQASDIFGALAATIGETLADVVDTVKAVADVVEDRIEHAIEKATEEE